MMEYFCNRSVDLYPRGSNLNKCRSRFPRRLRHLNGTPCEVVARFGAPNSGAIALHRDISHSLL